VLVHGLTGTVKSSAFLIAYVMAVHNLSVGEAQEYVSSRRGTTFLSLCQSQNTSLFVVTFQHFLFIESVSGFRFHSIAKAADGVGGDHSFRKKVCSFRERLFFALLFSVESFIPMFLFYFLLESIGDEALTPTCRKRYAYEALI